MQKHIITIVALLCTFSANAAEQTTPSQTNPIASTAQKQICGKDGASNLVFVTARNPAALLAHVNEGDISSFCSSTVPIRAYFRKNNNICYASGDLEFRRMYSSVIVPCEKVEKLIPSK